MDKPGHAGAKVQEWEAGPEPWVPSKHRGNQGLNLGTLTVYTRPYRARQGVGDSSAGMSPSSLDRLQLQRMEGHEQVGKQPTKYSVLTMCGKSRGRNKEAGSAGSRAERQQSGYSQSPKLQVLSYSFVILIYLEYMHESGESNPPFLFS